MSDDTKKTILLIDDDEELCEVLKEKLMNEDFAVEVAHTGASGLKKAYEIKPDLVLLDIMLPDGNGHDFLRKMRADEDWGKEAKVALLTNVSDLGSVSKAIDELSYDYIVKTDWSLPEIVERVHNLLNESKL